MGKLMIIFSLFSLFFNDFANADLKEEYRKENLVTPTNCNWNNAQFVHYNQYLLSTPRFCVDESNNTIFRIYKNGVPAREYGF